MENTFCSYKTEYQGPELSANEEANQICYTPQCSSSEETPFHVYMTHADIVDNDTHEKVADATKYDVYISSEIVEAYKYTYLLHLLRNANPYDLFNFYVNSPGGIYDTTLQLIMAMQNSPGSVVTHIDGSICSSASIIAAAGDFICAYPLSQVVFHNIQVSYTETTNNFAHYHSASTTEMYRLTLGEYCKSLLPTPEVVSSIVDKGTEVIYGPSEIKYIYQKYLENNLDKIIEYYQVNCPDTKKYTQDLYQNLKQFWPKRPKGSFPHDMIICK